MKNIIILSKNTLHTVVSTVMTFIAMPSGSLRYICAEIRLETPIKIIVMSSKKHFRVASFNTNKKYHVEQIVFKRVFVFGLRSCII